MFVTIESLIKDLKSFCRPFILLDSKQRENEGDLVIPVQLLTKKWMNFMITHCRGIPCVCITSSIQKKLGLDFMKRSDEKENCAHFTTTIEAKKGVTTGISAGDRAHTASLLVQDNIDADDFITPGHVLPLVINKEGLLARKGHTEGGATVAKLAGFKPVTAICEILDENGDSARLPFLQDFATKHQLNLVSIEDVITYLRDNDLDIKF